MVQPAAVERTSTVSQRWRVSHRPSPGRGSRVGGPQPEERVGDARAAGEVAREPAGRGPHPQRDPAGALLHEVGGGLADGDHQVPAALLGEPVGHSLGGHEPAHAGQLARVGEPQRGGACRRRGQRRVLTRPGEAHRVDVPGAGADRATPDHGGVGPPRLGQDLRAHDPRVVRADHPDPVGGQDLVEGGLQARERLARLPAGVLAPDRLDQDPHLPRRVAGVLLVVPVEGGDPLREPRAQGPGLGEVDPAGVAVQGAAQQLQVGGGDGHQDRLVPRQAVLDERDGHLQELLVVAVQRGMVGEGGGRARRAHGRRRPSTMTDRNWSQPWTCRIVRTTGPGSCRITWRPRGRRVAAWTSRRTAGTSA